MKEPLFSVQEIPVRDQITILAEQLKSFPWKIGIDGPAAAGKGTTVKALSTLLGIKMIETGLGYRGATWWFKEYKKLDLTRIEDCTDDQLRFLLQDFEIQFSTNESGVKRVLITHPDFDEPFDVSGELEDPLIGKTVSSVAKRDPVRDLLENQQVALLRQGGAIIEGRDTWSIARNEVDFLIYLFAENETLIAREKKRQADRGKQITDEEAREIVIGRNISDNNRVRGQLLTPDEAQARGFYNLILDTSNLSPDEVTLEILIALSGTEA